MYYKLEWDEKNMDHFQRVFQAMDVPSLWRAIHYMNQERIEKQRPIMKKLQITVLGKHYGNYSVISGDTQKIFFLMR